MLRNYVLKNKVNISWTGLLRQKEIFLEECIKMTRPFWFLTTVLVSLQVLTKQMLGYLSTIPWINSLYYKCALNLNSVLCISTQFSWLHLKTMVICSIFIISLVKTSKSKLIDNWQLGPNLIFSKRGSEKHKWPLHVVSVRKEKWAKLSVNIHL